VAPALADDGDEFPLVVELVRDTRPYQAGSVADEARWEPGEEGGVRWDLESDLLAMVLVVETQADDLARLPKWRKIFDGVEVNSRTFAQEFGYPNQCSGPCSDEGRDAAWISRIVCIKTIRRLLI
jgi:hypothetical protein